MIYEKSGILLQHILLFVCCLCTLVIIYDRITLVIIYDSYFMLNAAVGKEWKFAYLSKTVYVLDCSVPAECFPKLPDTARG